LRYQDRGIGLFVDRKSDNPELQAIDVIIFTLDEETFLERCLYSAYKEIPVRKLLVMDGGSKDNTLEILKKFPRVDVYVRPDFKTMGKGFEYMLSLVETEWFVFMDAHDELADGWYDEMIKHETSYDVLENSRRISAYHHYELLEAKLQENSRASDMCHLMRKEALRNYHCDDDYMWRVVDFFIRQTVENSGFKYKKIDTTTHIHHERSGIKYESDETKSFRKLVMHKPELIVLDKKMEKLDNIQRAKAMVKYLDPNDPSVKHARWLDYYLRFVDKKWVEENGPSWIERYKHASSLKFAARNFLWRHVVKPRKWKKDWKNS